MDQTPRSTLIGIIAFILVVTLGYFAWKERQSAVVPSAISSQTSTSTGTSIEVGTTTASTTSYTITPIPVAQVPKAPNYRTPLTYSSGMTADEKAWFEARFAAVQTTLALHPTDHGSWLNLGILRKETGDYVGAAADWKYVTEIYHTDPTAFANLGDLYANFMHQPSQGITFYKEAIKLDPTKEETFYDNLAQIYLNEGDKADAKATLQQGINVQVVGYQNLQTELSSMQ